MGQNTQRMTGSINVTRLMEAVQKAHSSMNQSPKNGQLYANVTIWLDLNAPDQNGNNISITLNSSREGEPVDKQKFEGKSVYVLNGKWPAPKQPPLNTGGYGQMPQQGYQQQPQPSQQWGQQQQPSQQWQQPQPQQGWGPQPQQPQQPQQGNQWGQQQQPGAQDKLPF